MIHGFLSSQRVWDGPVSDLRTGFRCWTVDLCGFGDSPAPDDSLLTFDDHVRHLINFCDTHGIRPHTVIGHSMGGMLALRLALTRPDLAERLVLVCPAVTGTLHYRLNMALTSVFGRLILARSRAVWDLVRRQTLARALLHKTYLGRPARERDLEDMRRGRWGATIGALDSIVRGDLTAQLGRVHQPVLVIVGSRDLTLPPSEGRTAARYLPYATLVEFENSHHEPFDEEPERFNALVRAFIEDSAHQAPAFRQGEEHASPPVDV